MSKEKYRSRVHLLLLYPDNEQHTKAVEKIKQSYDYAMVLHNRDYTTDGELKKPHLHVVLRYKQAVWSSAICKELEIEHNYIEQVKKFDNALMYLIHYNDNDKAQYTIDEVQGNLKTRLQMIINSEDKNEGERVNELIDYIYSFDRKLSVRELAVYSASNGYWSEFRRSATIMLKILEEHNNQFMT